MPRTNEERNGESCLIGIAMKVAYPRTIKTTRQSAQANLVAKRSDRSPEKA